jgi:DnaK suppressor protein
MDPKARARHRKRLVDLKAEILAEGDLAIEPGRTDPAAVGSDEDAQPLTEMSQTIASTRNRTRVAILNRVVAALTRVDDAPDTFGLCSECEEPIAPKRLELMPYVELCIECQQASDAPAGRPAAGTCATSADGGAVTRRPAAAPRGGARLDRTQGRAQALAVAYFSRPVTRRPGRRPGGAMAHGGRAERPARTSLSPRPPRRCRTPRDRRS